MSATEFDVVIAAYLIPDLASEDFDALVKLVTDKQLTVEGVALASAGSISAVIGWLESPAARMRMRSTTFFSCRTFPGHGCTCRVA